MSKWSNIALCLGVLATFFFMKERVHFSTDLFAFLPEGKHKRIAQNYWSASPSKEVFIAVEGLDANALATIKSLEKQVLDSGFFALQTQAKKSPLLTSYLEEYRYFIEDFTPKEIDVDTALRKLAEEISQSVLYSPVDTKDPFGFFSPPQSPVKPSLHRGHMRLGETGYVSMFKTKEGIDERKAYDFLVALEDDSIHIFSPLFYVIENPHHIQNSVNGLLVITVVLLGLIYIVMLRNFSLLFNTISTLVTSVLVALGVVSMVWAEVSLFVLAFGVAVSSLGVDYMFHHYFHNHYSQKKALNRSVFWGFATTASLFGLFLGIDFLLVKQFSLFALVSLVVAYVHFAFLYPKIGFKAPPKKAFFAWKRVPVRYGFIVVGSLVCLGLAWPWLHMDTNVRNLDYQNEKRLKEEAFFKSHLSSAEHLPFVLEAQNINDLIAKGRKLREAFPEVWLPVSNFLDKESFEKRAQKLKQLDGLHEKIELSTKASGFKEGYLKEAYREESLKKAFFLPSINQFHDMGMDVFNVTDGYVAKGYVPNKHRLGIEAWDGVYVMEANTLFYEAMQRIFDEVLWGGAGGIGLLLLMLWLSCKERFVYALAYILFPMALIATLFTQMSFSIMHLFMLFVFLALSVDYGIYMARTTHEESQTRTAIVFSLLSTCAGFGVLAFGNVGALQDLGTITMLGALAIGILLFVKERDEYRCGG